MKIFVGRRFLQRSKRLFKKRPYLKEKFASKIRILEINPTHPGLGLHKLRGRLHEIWAIIIEENLRVSFVYKPEGILLISIGSHDEIYRDLL